MFVAVGHFQPGLISKSKDQSLPLVWQYYTSVEVTEGDKHSSLLRYIIIYDHKKFYDSGPSIIKLTYS